MGAEEGGRCFDVGQRAGEAADWRRVCPARAKRGAQALPETPLTVWTDLCSPCPCPRAAPSRALAGPPAAAGGGAGANKGLSVRHRQTCTAFAKSFAPAPQVEGTPSTEAPRATPCAQAGPPPSPNRPRAAPRALMSLVMERMRRRESSLSRIMPSIPLYSSSATYAPISAIDLTCVRVWCVCVCVRARVRARVRASSWKAWGAASQLRSGRFRPLAALCLARPPRRPAAAPPPESTRLHPAEHERGSEEHTSQGQASRTRPLQAAGAALVPSRTGDARLRAPPPR